MVGLTHVPIPKLDASSSNRGNADAHLDFHKLQAKRIFFLMK
ncbi:hypothetical protein KP509_30G021000 [Ceratopteris richardii]|nr:hypothetical protein KP509_30G021000 [Ceratopteris richardii]